ncbi:MAG: class C sortase [Cellulomonadaceae bacterium]|jgi:sortase A|nr:class C sortase [Cellulomonadaceae bacterium]
MRRILTLVVGVACGLGLLLYPSAARWNTQRIESERTSRYEATERSEAVPVSQEYAAAVEYNTDLTASHVESFHAADASRDATYMNQLLLPGSDVMGEVIVPALNVRLPIYHGTSDEVLAVGAGHLYGTSLPVGGESTHTVVSAHAGMTEAEMFTHLHTLAEGQEFLLHAAGQTARYVVDKITTVLPEDTKDIQIVPGEDHATLVTCTPVGINSHRLLVRGIRTELAADDASMARTPGPGFPWWAAWFAGALAATALGGWGLTRLLAPKPAATVGGVS